MQREAQPAHFLLGAAHAAVDRRRAAQRAWELRPSGAAAAAPAVVPGAYVGQFLTAEGLRRLNEEEYLHFLEVLCSALAQDCTPSRYQMTSSLGINNYLRKFNDTYENVM